MTRQFVELAGAGNDLAGDGNRRLARLLLLRPLAEAVHQVGQVLRIEFEKPIHVGAAKNFTGNCERALAAPWQVRPLAKAVHQQRDISRVELLKQCGIVAAEFGDPARAFPAFPLSRISTE
ncbi:hypothetical protein [Mesorhizobium sp.]|uniref:hypothetical protein n=1 Tax=Mesorhizobium sp. TaxID=1871066 RepID=UPI0025BC5D46|nr:hypothetical protein [Mesorhizobium sp.]